MNATLLKEVLKALEVHGSPAPPAGVRPGPDDMLTTTELAARLKQAARTVERWHRKGIVLGIRVDGAVMFYWPAVVARLVERYQEREKEPQANAECGVRNAESPAPGPRTPGAQTKAEGKRQKRPEGEALKR
ncbi:MAG: hypothetical protein HZA90_10335 [Verrucomicrobia bacterium]|nr:hypothetical protein [Verrucomicrobiota bacterium]